MDSKTNFAPLGARLALASLIGLALAGTASAQSSMREVDSPGAHKEHVTAWRSDTTELTLAAKGDASGRDQIEHMILMKAGDSIVYAVEAPGAANLWHEFHGHTADAVTFYKKADGPAHGGALTAPFDGAHGWYLENRSDKPVLVRIRTSGFYQPDEGS